MLKIGDVIVYTTFGLCNVTGEKIMTFSGKENLYYVLVPTSNLKSEITIPSNNETIMKRVLPLISKDEANDLLNGISFLETYWIENDNLRKTTFSNIIKEGNRLEILKLIKSIKKHCVDIKGKGRKLHAIDEACMKDGLKLISEEFSYILNIDKIEIINIINTKMQF